VSCCKELCKLHHFKPGLCPYCRYVDCAHGVGGAGGRGPP
jgi:hypothetical protein